MGHFQWLEKSVRNLPMFGKFFGGCAMKSLAIVLAVLCVASSVSAEESADLTAVSVGINEFTFDQIGRASCRERV